jgi:hypothetical protein
MLYLVASKKYKNYFKFMDFGKPFLINKIGKEFFKQWKILID